MGSNQEIENLSSVDVVFITITGIARSICDIVCPIAAVVWSWKYNGGDFWLQFFLLLVVYKLSVAFGFELINFVYASCVSAKLFFSSKEEVEDHKT